MEYVDPIKEIDSLNKIKALLKEKSKRDYLLFVFGINTGIRINELLNLKVHDVLDRNEVKEFLIIPETEKHNEQTFFLNDNVKEAIKDYLSDIKLTGNDFLFKSKNYDTPITRQQAYRIINQAAKKAGINGKIGTHTIRKTFGYHAYKKGIAISILKSIYGHNTPSETLKYIGVNPQNEHPIRVDVNL
ncbi:tyrosine-type recombinase/integrase [Ornithinibacillus halophilus]|uniref:Phage integrase family protein n=1 Tax=Ornithinibacillus halophilus TaxID=930117 RepID=A0A1M5EVB7_9BACI|nr:tyrosine-type recombinase/integrase [Ornithinibacillus halophilus]SHF83021.1 Phage integrase family protein [Ornithinibacillus halophilus]